jgi:hypothetical protein
MIVGTETNIQTIAAGLRQHSHSWFGGTVETHDDVFVLSKIFTCFEMGPPLRAEEVSLHLYWGVTLLTLTLTYSHNKGINVCVREEEKEGEERKKVVR